MFIGPATVYQDPDADSVHPGVSGEERLRQFANVIWKAESEKALRMGRVNDVSEYRMSLSRDDFIALAQRIDRLLRTTGIGPVVPQGDCPGIPTRVATPESALQLAATEELTRWVPSVAPNGDDEEDANQWLMWLDPLLWETATPAVASPE